MYLNAGSTIILLSILSNSQLKSCKGHLWKQMVVNTLVLKKITFKMTYLVVIQWNLNPIMRSVKCIYIYIQIYVEWNMSQLDIENVF